MIAVTVHRYSALDKCNTIKCKAIKSIVGSITSQISSACIQLKSRVFYPALYI
jgi:hypothetical protein